MTRRTPISAGHSIVVGRLVIEREKVNYPPCFHHGGERFLPRFCSFLFCSTPRSCVWTPFSSHTDHTTSRGGLHRRSPSSKPLRPRSLPIGNGGTSKRRMSVVIRSTI